jgi:hypothetical protein
VSTTPGIALGPRQSVEIAVGSGGGEVLACPGRNFHVSHHVTVYSYGRPAISSPLASLFQLGVLHHP